MDKWVAEDKAFHMSASYMAANILQHGMVLPLTILTVLCAGMLVEIWQKQHGKDHISYKDLVADTVGTILGVIF